MAGCNELTRGINPDCAATRKPGGLNKRLYIGLLFDLAAVVFGAGNLVTGFTFAGTPSSVAISAIANGALGAATITVASAVGIKIGTVLTVSGANGDQTSSATTINGQTFIVTAINGLVLTVDKEISGTTPASSGSAAFNIAKGFVKVIGKREKHNSTMALEVGENFNLRNHGVNAVVYYNTPEELAALDELVDVEGAFIVAETNSGELEVWGLNLGPNWPNFGLKAATLEGGSGTAITDSNIYTLGLTGNHENLQLYFKSAPEATLAADTAILDALSVWPVSA